MTNRIKVLAVCRWLCSDGALAVISVLEGGYVEEASGITDEDISSEGAGISDLESPDISLTERILFGAFIFGIIGLFTVLGIMTPGTGWFLYLFLIPFWAIFPIVVAGTKGTLVLLIRYLVTYPTAKLLLFPLSLNNFLNLASYRQKNACL